MVTRNSAPPQSQVEKLVSLLEVRKHLATGHARTALARARLRAEWAEIAEILNSDETGCVRKWNQWAKYWRDKKGAVKRKVNFMNAARTTGRGGRYNAEDYELTDTDKKILAIIEKGESNASNDGGLLMQDEDEMASPHKVFLERTKRESESPPASDVRSSDEECTRRFLFVPTPQQRRRLLQSSQGLNGDSPQRRRDVHRTTRGLRRSPSSQRRSPASQRRSPASQRRSPASQRRSPASQRRSPPSQRRSPPSQRRSPPAQRHFEMASLSYRSAAIEERRIEAELAIARSTEMLADGQRVMAAAVDNLANTVTLVAQQIIEVIQNNRAPNI